MNNNPLSYVPKVKKMEKFVNWEIEFKKDADDLKKNKAISRIEKYIILDMFKQDRSALLFNFQLTIAPNVGKDKAIIRVDLVVGETGIVLVPPPKPARWTRKGFHEHPECLTKYRILLKYTS